MQTPVLSKNQVKQTISSKKKTSATIKNVLASPYTNFWPLLSTEDNEKLHQILLENLPEIHKPKTAIPWSVIQSVPKDKRKQFRIDFNKDSIEIDQETKPNKHNFVFGINDVTAGLENNQLVAVLVANEVEPHLMVQHLIDQCVLCSVNILVVNNLKTITKQVLGFASAALGLKNTKESDSKFNVIVTTVTNLAKSYPVPEDHINYKRSKTNIFNISDEDLEMAEVKQKVNPVLNEAKMKEIKKSVYLTRDSKSQRVFVPEDSIKTIKIPGFSNTSFISFENEETESVNIEQVQDVSHLTISSDDDSDAGKSTYKPLIIKRLQGNPNRNQRKIEMMKQRKKKPRKKKK